MFSDTVFCSVNYSLCTFGLTIRQLSDAWTVRACLILRCSYSQTIFFLASFHSVCLLAQHILGNTLCGWTPFPGLQSYQWSGLPPCRHFTPRHLVRPSGGGHVSIPPVSPSPTLPDATGQDAGGKSAYLHSEVEPMGVSVPSYPTGAQICAVDRCSTMLLLWGSAVHSTVPRQEA